MLRESLEYAVLQHFVDEAFYLLFGTIDDVNIRWLAKRHSIPHESSNLRTEAVKAAVNAGGCGKRVAQAAASSLVGGEDLAQSRPDHAGWHLSGFINHGEGFREPSLNAEVRIKGEGCYPLDG